MKNRNLKMMPFVMLGVIILAQGCDSNRKAGAADSTQTGHEMTHDAAASESTDNLKNGSPVNQFLEQAAVGGLVEVEMGKLGQQRASLQSIKDFAAMIEKDHLEANRMLTDLAAAKSFKIPAELPASKKEHLKDLNTTVGKNFDNTYINMMVEDHIVDIALYRGAAKSPDTAVSTFAMKILPLLEKHYKQAREISMQFDQNKGRK